VEQGVRDSHRLGEIREELGEAAAGHEALVDDRPARGGWDRQVVEPRSAGRGLQAAAPNDEAALEGAVADRTAIGIDWALDDRLDDIRPCGGRGGPEGARVHGHAPPRGDPEPLVGQRGGDDRPGPRRSPAPSWEEGDDDR
jgi:hypothetical protein